MWPNSTKKKMKKLMTLLTLSHPSNIYCISITECNLEGKSEVTTGDIIYHVTPAATFQVISTSTAAMMAPFPTMLLCLYFQA